MNFDLRNIKSKIKKAISLSLSAALLMPAGTVTARAAEAAAAATYQGADIAADFVTLKLSAPSAYNSFVTQTPPRLVVELLNTKHEGPSKSMKGQGSFLAGVRSGQFEKEPRLITRVVMDLIKMAGYKISTVPTGLTVQLTATADEDDKTAEKSAPAPVAVPAPPAQPIVAAAATPAPVAVAPIPVAKDDEEEAKPASEAVSVPVVAAPVEPEPVPAPAPVPAVKNPVRPKVRSNTAAHAVKRAGLDRTMSPELAAGAQASDLTVITSDPVDDFDPSSESSTRQTGGRIFRDITSRLPRDLVSLDFDNTDIRDVLRMLAAKSKINIVFGPDVSGNLTLHLTDVPFNEAFRTTLSMMKLTTDQVGDNILRVMTPAELTKQRTTSTAITKVYVLNYAKASEVKTTIDSVRTAEGRSGSSTAETKSNTLIVTDTLEGQLATENLIAQIDQRPRQVLIEAKLVEVNINAGLNYGVQWDAFGIERGKIGGKQGVTGIGTTVGTLDDPYSMTLDRNVIATPKDGTTGAGLGGSGRGTGVSLAADRIFGAFTLGRVTNNMFLNATLTAAASEGKAKVLSEPKIATLNNQAANINVTTQNPYTTVNVTSAGQSQSVTYVTSGIQLTVTPSINADGRVTLQITPKVSQASVAAPGTAPSIDSRDAQTTVLVRDGETIVIGGLISDSLQDSISKIPLLGDIPVLGWLFKKKTKTRQRSELLIFVTTRILPD